LTVVLSLVVFVVVSLLAFVVALRFVDGVAWPAVIGVFCGFAAATVLNVTDVMARRKGRDSTGGETGTGGRDDQRGTAAYLSLVADPGE
jgi:membrane protein implicated in regulation of membrane protease activity